MNYKTLEKVSRVWFSLFLLQARFLAIFSFDFDRNYFGVSFVPYVKQAENGTSIPSPESYTFDDVKTMLSVVSGKFTNVLVNSDFLIKEDDYIPGISYKNGSYATVYSAEAAAQLNVQNSSKIVTLLYTIRMSYSFNETKARMLLALEAADKANQIYLGTLQGIGIGYPRKLSDMEQVLDLLQMHRRNASQTGLKLGAWISCHDLISQDNDALADARHQIVKSSDFILCHNAFSDPFSGPTDSFERLSNEFIQFRDYIHRINADAEAIASTHWSSSGLSKQMTVENLRVYWQTANNWAVSNKYRIFLIGAIDSMWYPAPADHQLGWWRLENNSGINSINGYVEKVVGLPTERPEKISSKSGTFTTPDENVPKEDHPVLSIWHVAIISLTVIVVVIGIVAGVLVLVFLLYRNKGEQLSSGDVRDFMQGNLNKHGSGSKTPVDSATNAPYDTSLEISKRNVKIDRNSILGSGEFGVVYKALLQRPGGFADQVALKVAKDNCSASTVKGMLSEIKVMTFLGKHPNIVALKGAYTAELSQGVVYIATELCELGSLEKYLRKKGMTEENKEVDAVVCDGKTRKLVETELTTVVSISVLDKCQWAYEIACGMKYLESKHVVHADLAARNVLLTSEKVAKISDFGLSRRMYNYTNYVKKQQEPLPWRWMAIEALKKMEFSSKSDVWSYGITLWEIFSEGDIPYSGVTWTLSFVTKLVHGLRPACPPHSSPEFYNLMRDCWNFEAEERPNFSELVEFTCNALDKCRASAGREQ